MPYADVLNTAAANAGRTEDRIDASEQLLLQRFATTKLRTVWNQCIWPDLICWPPPQVAVANHQFSKNEGQAGEMGDILGFYDRLPLDPDRAPRFDFREGNGIVFIDGHESNVWPLFLPPTPNLMLYNAGTVPVLLAYQIPEEFANYLASHMAAKLAIADNQYALAQQLTMDAQIELASAQSRAWDKLPVWLKRPLFGSNRRHRRLGHVPGAYAVAEQ